jgi:hypothetical protein
MPSAGVCPSIFWWKLRPTEPRLNAGSHAYCMRNSAHAITKGRAGKNGVATVWPHAPGHAGETAQTGPHANSHRRRRPGAHALTAGTKCAECARWRQPIQPHISDGRCNACSAFRGGERERRGGRPPGEGFSHPPGSSTAQTGIRNDDAFGHPSSDLLATRCRSWVTQAGWHRQHLSVRRFAIHTSSSTQSNRDAPEGPQCRLRLTK